MRVFVAGATGAIGRPLVESLVAAGHEVTGMTRSPSGNHWLVDRGVRAAVVDAFDARAVHEALAEARPHIVIEQLTALPRLNTPDARRAAAPLHNRLRREGGANVQNAARAAGVQRYIAQSSAFWLEPGAGWADELTPFARALPPATMEAANALQALEKRVLEDTGLTGVILRYGFFYGPGTWYAQDGSAAVQARQGELPIIGKGAGTWSFVHIEDAARATCLAIERAHRGIYNIVDNQPLSVGEWLPAFARWTRAPAPRRLTADEALRTIGPDAVYYGMHLRGVSNAKARRELGLRPRPLGWLRIADRY